MSATWHIVEPTCVASAQWSVAMYLAVIPQLVRWLHGMLPHGMHPTMWWSEVLPCHLYPTDMCIFAPIVLCHVSPSGEVAADVEQWVSATWHVWGPLVRYPALGWGPPVLTWTNGVVTRGSYLQTWPNLVLPHGTPSLLFCFILLLFFAPQAAVVPKLYQEKLVIKSQPLINSFNMLYLLWIYFNSFNYSKILKFSPKISKFMVITLVIFNFTFAIPSLCWKFLCQENIIFLPE
jgi:hypothetical protein